MEEETKTAIDKICQKNNLPTTRNIPTSEQYDDLVQATKGRFTETYYNFLVNKYGRKWVMSNAFASPEEMIVFEKSMHYNPEIENEDYETSATMKKNSSTELGESTKFSHDGLSHIFLLYAKGIIQELTPEQFSLIYLELYGKLLSPETCTKLVAQINENKKQQVNMLFTERIGDSILVANAISYIKSKAQKEKWSVERLNREITAVKSAAKYFEKEIGVTFGRAWVHDIAKESKDSALKKTFNFVMKKIDNMLSGTVRDIADIDVVSTRKIKIEKN